MKPVRKGRSKTFNMRGLRSMMGQSEEGGRAERVDSGDERGALPLLEAGGGDGATGRIGVRRASFEMSNAFGTDHDGAPSASTQLVYEMRTMHPCKRSLKRVPALVLTLSGGSNVESAPMSTFKNPCKSIKVACLDSTIRWQSLPITISEGRE